MHNPLMQLVNAHKQKGIGLCSICSANQFVLEAAMLQSQADRTPLLIEATSNQVNQFGGYTGMTPKAFVAYVQETARRMAFPFRQVILGGDHLGPQAWQNESAKIAMTHAREQVRAYVAAGFKKVHLDTSMRCDGDPCNEQGGLPMELAVERAAQLCQVCEAASEDLPSDSAPPVYVIGTEVPPPGGAKETLDHISPTRAHDAGQTISSTHQAFFTLDLNAAWQRVVALVVQPGVEFGDDAVIHYRRREATGLAKFIEAYDHLVYEAHSTDYQKPEALRELVEDHFAILKVGPWLTFAMREAVFALTRMEEEWLAPKRAPKRSRLREVLDPVMCAKPQHWHKHYHGDEAALAFARKYSYSDRIRYYWNEPEVVTSLQLLLANLATSPVPPALLSQYLPVQHVAVQEGSIANRPADWIHHKIQEVLKIYRDAVRNREWALNRSAM
jgi:D-tagatose-1,6-bisphosphate aldolase subunit GatZ/KbaZ